MVIWVVRMMGVRGQAAPSAIARSALSECRDGARHRTPSDSCTHGTCSLWRQHVGSFIFMQASLETAVLATRILNSPSTNPPLLRARACVRADSWSARVPRWTPWEASSWHRRCSGRCDTLTFRQCGFFFNLVRTRQLRTFRGSTRCTLQCSLAQTRRALLRALRTCCLA